MTYSGAGGGRGNVVSRGYLRPRLGRCVRALPAADFADLDADLDANVLAAAEAAFELVTFELFDWASALPAAAFDALLAPLDPKVFPAADAAFAPVRSDAMVLLSRFGD